MDKALRILQKLSINDPEAKERYIHALERSVGLSPPGLEDPLQLIRDMHSLGWMIGDYILKNGNVVHLAESEVILWTSPTGSGNKIEGLALGVSTDQIAGALYRFFPEEFTANRIKNWLVEPALIYDNVIHQNRLVTQSIFIWEVETRLRG